MAHVGRNHQRQGARRSCVFYSLVKAVLAPARKDHAVPILQKRKCHGFSDAAACAGDKGDFVVTVHCAACSEPLALALHRIPCRRQPSYHAPLQMPIIQGPS
jgi:hypothetical protein